MFCHTGPWRSTVNHNIGPLGLNGLRSSTMVCGWWLQLWIGIAILFCPLDFPQPQQLVRGQTSKATLGNPFWHLQPGSSCNEHIGECATPHDTISGAEMMMLARQFPSTTIFVKCCDHPSGWGLTSGQLAGQQWPANLLHLQIVIIGVCKR
mmetsp:Transcript_59986/g.98977  ORF Transcript_59986/g.98977 Transcript_59986/m.98977 type:complete len:151 (+) Transcript_59986:150-602(+)